MVALFPLSYHKNALSCVTISYQMHYLLDTTDEFTDQLLKHVFIKQKSDMKCLKSAFF